MHAEIIAKLEAAEGPSLVLDGQVWCALAGYEFIAWDGAGCVYRNPAAPEWDRGIKHAQASIVRPYTASLDAAIALVERVLPGAYRASGKTAAYPGMIPGSPPEKFFARVGDWGEPVRSYHDCEPVAILLALFRALSARTQGGNDEAE